MIILVEREESEIHSLQEAKGPNSSRFNLSKTVIHSIANIMDSCFDFQIIPEFDIVWFKGSAKGRRKDALGYATAVNKGNRVEVLSVEVNDTIPMPELIFRAVVLHELVHVLMFQQGYVYEGHGKRFTDACNVIEKKYPEFSGLIAGAEVTFEKDLDVVDVETKPYHVVLIEDPNFSYGMGAFGVLPFGDWEKDYVDRIATRGKSSRAVYVFRTTNKVFKSIVPAVVRDIKRVDSYAALKPSEVTWFKKIEDDLIYGVMAIDKKIVNRDVEVEDLPWNS